MKAYEIAEIIEKTAPKELAYDWDNPGFQCGDSEREVGCVLICLDVTPESVAAAVKCGADMIISHHPMFFRGIKRIDFSTPQGAMIKELVQNDICVYSAHTNMDTAPGGINTALADICGLCETRIIERHTPREDAGLGLIGRLKYPCTAAELASLVKARLNARCLRFVGDKSKVITTAAVASGSCSELVPKAQEMGAECIITSDIKYHEALDAKAAGMIIIDAGHYPTENFVTGIFAAMLAGNGIEIEQFSGEDVFMSI